MREQIQMTPVCLMWRDSEREKRECTLSESGEEKDKKKKKK